MPHLSSIMRRFCHTFSLIELLVVMTIIAILAGILLPYLNKTDEPIGKSSTRADIFHIETAIEAYRKEKGSYPLESVAGAINLSDDSNVEVKKVIIELLKLESFEVNEHGVPQDHWEHPIYLIYAKNYESSPLAASIPNLGEKVYYNPRSFQIVSGGADGTATSLGAAEDNVANYPKK